MNSQVQTILVCIIVCVALIYLLLRAKKKLTAKKLSCGGCDKCG